MKFHKTKKSEIQAQIFLYVLALIVVAMILLYGYTTVKKLKKDADTVVLIQLRTQLQQSVKTTMPAYRSVHKETFDVPAKYDEVCFVDLKYSGIPPNLTKNMGRYPVIYDSVETGSSNNVFFKVKDGLEEEGFYVGVIKVDGTLNTVTTSPNFGDPAPDDKYDGDEDGFYCVKVSAQGKIKVRFLGKGTFVGIAEWKES